MHHNQRQILLSSRHSSTFQKLEVQFKIRSLLNYHHTSVTGMHFWDAKYPRLLLCTSIFFSPPKCGISSEHQAALRPKLGIAQLRANSKVTSVRIYCCKEKAETFLERCR